MVAYSFKREFVNSIRLGLGLPAFDDFPPAVAPKRHTIREDRERGHAEPGRIIHLFYGMRSKHCRRIGDSPVIERSPVDLQFESDSSSYAAIRGCLDLSPWGYRSLDDFARGDGFESWDAMREFWRKVHGVTRFAGTIIFWRGDR